MAGGERTVLAAFARDGLSPHMWSSAPHDRFAMHEHSYHKVLCCVRGVITFTLAANVAIVLAPGDRLDIPPHTRHSAVVGAAGVTCIEAARPAEDAHMEA